MCFFSLFALFLYTPETVQMRLNDPGPSPCQTFFFVLFAGNSQPVIDLFVQEKTIILKIVVIRHNRINIEAKYVNKLGNRRHKNMNSIVSVPSINPTA